MRYIPPLALLISVYLVVTLLCDIYNCQDTCQQSELEKYEKVIFVNATYKYTHYYNYSQRIRTKQSNPVVNGTFETFNTTQEVRSKFPFQFLEVDIKQLWISETGLIIIESITPGLINHIMPGIFLPQFEMLHNDESIAVNWYFRTRVDDTYITSKVTNLIHRNGKISIYYENIPTEIEDRQLYTKLQSVVVCSDLDSTGTFRFSEIMVPSKWIKSNTLVEFEPIERKCSIHNSTEECQNATTSNMRCIWCGRANMCISSNDKDTHELKVIDCLIKNTTVNIHVTEHNKQNNTLHYLYIVIPIAVSFCVVCTGCFVGRWLYKRKNSNS
ncbi:unnamed protein product [Schistosoma haematobium]|nr:unnamed protein product [Schistosoma haematobium]